MTASTAPLCLVNLPQDVLNYVAELLNREDRRALLHLALASPAFYAACLHVAIRTDTDGGRLDYGGGALPHLRELGVSFDKSLFLDREKSVAATTTLFSLVPPSLTVLKIADLGEDALQVAAKLVRQLPSLAELHLVAYRHRTIEGFDLVMAALPRSGFPYLHMVLDTTDVRKPSSWHEEDVMIDQLVTSFPHSVQSLFISSSVWVPRVPLATHALVVNVDTMLHYESSEQTASLLAPTLKCLTIDQLSEFDHDFTPVFEQLPASLVHLELRSLQLSRDALVALAHSFPPHLESLHLCGEGLTASDLDQYLTGAWPSTLSHLDLTSGFEFKARLPTIPPSVRVLTMDLARALLSRADGDAMVAAWITSLPVSVRVLKLYLNSTFRSAFVDVLLMVTRVRAPGWRHMHKWNEKFDLPVSVSAALTARFASFDVVHAMEDESWRRTYGDFL
ncbi:hypothetical protein GGF32_003911 [Allomyces javanicus]|nr:hypothetical protein GGF32_003911 [Allomyces javanicus]